MMAPMCNICTENLFDPGKDVSAVPCGHTFHRDCLDQWWDSEQSCPNCRTTFGWKIDKLYLATEDEVLESDSQDVQERLQFFQSNLEERENDVIRMLEEKEALENRLSASEVERLNFEQITSEKQQEIDELNSRIEGFILNIGNMENTIADLSQNNDSLQSQIASAQEEMHHFEDYWLHEKSKLIEDLSASQKEIDSSRSREDSLEQLIDQMMEDLHTTELRLKNEIDEHNKLISTIQEQLDLQHEDLAMDCKNCIREALIGLKTKLQVTFERNDELYNHCERLLEKRQMEGNSAYGYAESFQELDGDCETWNGISMTPGFPTAGPVGKGLANCGMNLKTRWSRPTSCLEFVDLTSP